MSSPTLEEKETAMIQTYMSEMTTRVKSGIQTQADGMKGLETLLNFLFICNDISKNKYPDQEYIMSSNRTVHNLDGENPKRSTKIAAALRREQTVKDKKAKKKKKKKIKAKKAVAKVLRTGAEEDTEADEDTEAVESEL